MSTISRRRFIGRTAALGAGLWAARALPSLAAPGPATLDPAPFEFGVASGDPLIDRVLLWTRVSPSSKGPVEVSWKLASDPGMRSVVARGNHETDLARDYTVGVDATGLEPGQTYWYRFEVDGQESRIGRTKTAPERTDRVLYAVASCQDFQNGYYAAWSHIAAKELDFVLHLGDYIYEYGDDGDDFRPHRPKHEIVALSDYRQRYACYRSDPMLRAAHAAHPFVTAWDDHEVTNDTYEDGAENHQPDEEGRFLNRRERAYRAYFEWMPIRRPAPKKDPTRIYRQLRFGDMVDLFVLDTRQYRDEQIGTFATPNYDPALSDPERTILGDKEERWLHGQLSRSDTSWRMIGTQVMATHFKYGILPDEAATAMHQITGAPRDGMPVNPDDWNGYQADRRQLLEHIRDGGIPNVMFFTGDIHTSWASEIRVDPGDLYEAPVAAEFVGPSITSANFDEILGIPPRTASVGIEAAIIANNPHIRYVELDSHGYMTVDVTKEKVRGDWFFVSDHRDPKASERLGASWEVRDGDLLVRPPA